MNDHVEYGVPLLGCDTETRAINAIVHLIENCNFSPTLDMMEGKLNAMQKCGIATYLAHRYGFYPSANPESQ
jgi:hypothetical protein